MGPAAIGALAHATSLYAAFGLLAGLVALQFIIARYVYQKSFIKIPMKKLQTR